MYRLGRTVFRRLCWAQCMFVPLYLILVTSYGYDYLFFVFSSFVIMLGSSELKPTSAGNLHKRKLDLARTELELERRELEYIRKYQLGFSHKVETVPACCNATSLFTLSATGSSSSVDQKLVSDSYVNENPFSKDMHNPFSSNNFANLYQLSFQQLRLVPNSFATPENRHKGERSMYHQPAPVAMNDQSRVSELIDALSIMTNSTSIN